MTPGTAPPTPTRTWRLHEPLSAASVAALQNNLTDSLASRVLPSLLTALGTASLSSSERTVVSLLSSWNYAMDAGWAAATGVVDVLE